MITTTVHVQCGSAHDGDGEVRCGSAHDDIVVCHVEVHMMTLAMYCVGVHMSWVEPVVVCVLTHTIERFRKGYVIALNVEN
ncbi:Uncharacterized protein TCM_003646 [Theobroma cacao]|uniref:Uncharacterized protein n=1 Tax=Theobroma cacao TaxID=3641 RepID=A0A061DN45_THECC|nr:Uncharacterized protein TCM_003646 [Theobroma cacao]